MWWMIESSNAWAMLQAVQMSVMYVLEQASAVNMGFHEHVLGVIQDDHQM